MRKSNILLVEDNEGDVVLLKEVFSSNGNHYNISVVFDGEEALKYLRKKDKYENAETPDLILLDINLPKVSGTEVLEQIKNDPKLRSIPVVVLTTSSAQTDISKAYVNHANCFITKPPNLDQFVQCIQNIELYWFSECLKLPNA